MTKKIIYKKAPKNIADAISSAQIIQDFLPPPEQLIKKEDNVKVTIVVSKNSINFFKENAQKVGIPYQKMIKTVLDQYTHFYQKTPPK